MRLESIALVANSTRESSRNAQILHHRYLWVGASRERCPYVFAHAPSQSYSTFPLSESLHLYSILPSFSSLPHSSSANRTALASYPPPLLSFTAVVILEVDFLLAYSPLQQASPLFLSLSSYVKCWEWMDPGSVFIGSVISTACSRAPLRG